MIPKVPEATIHDDKKVVKSKQTEFQPTDDSSESESKSSFFTTPDGRSYTGD